MLRGKPIRIINEQEESAVLKRRDADVAAQRTGSTKDASSLRKDLGILALSEIVFDNTHHFAILKYVFLCGSHCNSGAIFVLLGKVGDRWTASRRPCEGSVVLNGDSPRS